MDNLIETQEKAKLVRKWCLVSTTEAGSGHPTSCLSAADLTTVLFDRFFSYDLDNPLNLFNDRIVFSKGHAAPLLYTLFGVAGAYPLAELKTLRQFGSVFEGHPVPKFKYADAATGSLGQGLSVGAGLALVAKRESFDNKVYVLTGDGELAEGQIWEAANLASKQKLDNLVAILDINRLGQSQETMFGHHMDEYIRKFQGFDFEVISINGHDYDQINQAFETVQRPNGKPYAIIAETFKGHGVSFIENKDGWHGKALNKEELEKALKELGPIDDKLRFHLRKPKQLKLPRQKSDFLAPIISIDKNKEHATRETFGEVLAKLSDQNKDIYALDGDVMNSTFTETFKKDHPERFVECYIAEQNMVSVAVGLARLGKIPIVATFAAFLSRAADQVRMASISEANIKFVGSHVGVSIGEDGPSQMGLEDISLFGSLPASVILQPCDAISTAKLVPEMVNHNGFAYMRTLRPKTALLYKMEDSFAIGGSTVIRHSEHDQLTVAGTGITVFEAMKAADQLQKEGIPIRVVDCYSIHPVDASTLKKCLNETEQKILITVEDHFVHGGFGDFVASALSAMRGQFIKMAVTKISQSGTKDELLSDAGIDAASIVTKVKSVLKKRADEPHFRRGKQPHKAT